MKSRKQYLKEADKQLKSILEASGRFDPTPAKKKMADIQGSISALRTNESALSGNISAFEKDAQALANKMMTGKRVTANEIKRLDDYWSMMNKAYQRLEKLMTEISDGLDDYYGEYLQSRKK